MSDPKFFDVSYSINPWMDPTIPIDKDEAKFQWQELKRKIEECGAEVLVAGPPRPEVPDFVFAANAGMVWENKAILTNFRDEERKPETDIFDNWFTTAGYETFLLNSTNTWEGEACMFPIAGHLLCSYGIRADKSAYEEIIDIISFPKHKIVFAEIIDPYFYHLDVCFCPLSEDTAMYCEMAFTTETKEWLRRNVKNLISVSYDEALNFACNALVVGKNVIVNRGISLELKEALLSMNFIPIETPVHEYIRAGGGVKCLCLYLDKWQ